MSPIAALANLMVLLAGILFFVLPEMSRPGILFGVSVSADFRNTAEGRKLLVSYRRVVALFTLALIVVTSLAPTRELIIPLRIALAAILGIGGWIWFWRKTIPFAHPSSSIRTASLTPQRQMVPGGWLFVLGPYLILAIAILFLYVNWNSIPERFPMHWGSDGLPDRWTTRTVMGVFGLPLIGLITTTVTVLMALAIFFRTPTSRFVGAIATGDMAFKRATFFVILFVDYFISIFFSIMAARPVWAADPVRVPSRMAPFIVMATLALVVGTIVYLMRVSRARTGSGDGTPDVCWKWGMFYYNPSDASLFVERRMGIGWTLNFANKWAWALVAMPLLPTAIILIVTQFVK